MGFFSKGIGRALAGVATMGGSEAYRAGKKFIGGQTAGNEPDTAAAAAQKAEMDKYQKMVDDQEEKTRKAAQAYRGQLPGLQKQAGEQFSQTGRRDLSEKLLAEKQGMSKRGLLYSGLKEKQATKSTEGMFSDVAQKQASFNEQTEAQAKQLEDQALQASLQAQAARVGSVQQQYGQALQNKMQQQKSPGLLGAISSGIGGLLGGGFGKS